MSADEIIKFQQMLKDGIINKDEFERKKAEILGTKPPLTQAEKEAIKKHETIKNVIAVAALLCLVGVVLYMSNGAASMRFR